MPNSNAAKASILDLQAAACYAEANRIATQLQTTIDDLSQRPYDTDGRAQFGMQWSHDRIAYLRRQGAALAQEAEYWRDTPDIILEPSPFVTDGYDATGCYDRREYEAAKYEDATVPWWLRELPPR